ncbi:MAG: hypothetical protein DHS20C18_54800 [Saprospiraceae bacterium]|nr:MAG: hypothetical protein DHS20C18_54800 [Saprospiraceae bacterium]
MKSQKDPFEVFKNNQHKLSEKPSAQAWRRLERRLDAHQNHRKYSWFSQMGMVAAVLLLVALITIISTLTEQKKVLQTASQEAFPAQMEELSTSVDQQEMLKVVEFSRRYQERLTKPSVNEGKQGKKLVPNPKTSE